MGFFCRAWKIALQDARTNTVSVLLDFMVIEKQYISVMCGPAVEF